MRLCQTALPAANAEKSAIVFSIKAIVSRKTPTSAEEEQTDGDLLEIEPKLAYPTDYNETGDIAKVERDENTLLSRHGRSFHKSMI